MENNVGGKIKTVAKVILVIMILSALGGGLTAAIFVGKATAVACPRTVTKTEWSNWYDDYYSYEVKEKNGAAGFFAGAGVFIAIGAVGCVAAYVSYLFLYSYGQLVEDTQRNRSTNEENQKTLKEILSALKKNGSGAQPKNTETEKEAVRTSAASVVAPGKMRCPRCGSIQPAGRNVCWECGAPFTPSGKTGSASDQITLSDIAEYALKYTADEGMIAYLHKQRDTLSANDRTVLKQIFELPDAEIRGALKSLCRDSGAPSEADQTAEQPKNEGEALTWTCSVCKTVNPMRNRYCRNCGERCR